MATISLRGVRKRFQSTEILHGIDLDIAEGEFVVFVGPSGCGKSTLLRLICGLDTVSDGTIAIDGEVVNDVPPARRGIAMVFQSYALYPHMSVAQNMGYALRLAGTPKPEIASRVGKAASILRLDALLDRKPRQLSGGQRQRVAIGRAIVREPKIFLFDEPLSNLDAALRVDMRAEIAALKARLGTTMVYVTHDQTEAMTLADRIVVMRDGRIEQVGRPLDLYRHPSTTFVAGFIGHPRMNLVPAKTDAQGRPVLPGGGALPLVVAAPGTSLTVGLRAEALTPSEEAAAALSGTVELIEHLGSDAFVHLAVAGAPDRVILRVPPGATPTVGDRLGLAIDLAALHLFGADGRRLDVPHPSRNAA